VKRILVTGGCGFIGHHFVEHLLRETDWEIVVLDKLTYASTGLRRLRDIEAFDGGRVKVFAADLAEPLAPCLKDEMGEFDYIVHMAAETHVDRSIEDARSFVKANVLGTLGILEYAREVEPDRMVYFSTDEVFGPAPEGRAYKEWDRYNSGNPYAATKAGGEELALAFQNTYGVPVFITHTMNAYGERQHPEKFIPKVIRKVRDGEMVTIHADKTRTVSGSRCWIHAREIANALTFLLPVGVPGEKYNIVGEEKSNLDIALMISSLMPAECPSLSYEMVDFHSSRPGHDLRYALDGSFLACRGWKPTLSLEESLRKTVEWTLARPEWLEAR